MPRAPQLPDKHRVRDAVLEKLVEQLAQAVQVADDTRRAATHEEAKPENDKDTRGLEQSYLARGQAMRVEELVEQRDQLKALTLGDFTAGKPIGAGALLTLESESGTRCVFLLPYGGGIELCIDGQTVQVITPPSALGALVLGRSEGDDIELKVRGKTREYVIAEVL